MQGKYYALTEVDGEKTSRTCAGFGVIADLLASGKKVKFRAFSTETAAQRYLETGCSCSSGHSRGGVIRTSVKATRVSSKRK